jgi:uncharacterized protein (TIGR02466 family)
MPVLKLFPTRVYEEAAGPARSLARLNERLLKECYQLKDMDEAGRNWSRSHYPGGYTSYGSLDELFRMSSNFDQLRKLIDRHVARFARELDFDLRGRKLEMTSLWVNIVPKYTYHGLHLHPLSTLSGTYYLSVPPKSGAIQFEDPRLASFMAAPPRRKQVKPENQNFFRIQPKAGRIVLFESWLRHEVLQNQDDSDRVSVSFNYHWS